MCAGGAGRGLFGVCLAIVLALLCAGLVPDVAGASANSGARSSVRSDATEPQPRLVAVPAYAEVADGTVADLSAQWAESPPSCRLVPAWYAWSWSGPDSGGILNATFGPGVTFTAGRDVSGVVTVRVDSVVEQVCPSGESTAFGTAVGQLSIELPLAIEQFRASEALLPVGGTAAVSGVVAGGQPPYSVNLSWGDGSLDRVPVAPNGSFAASHPYPNGTFWPTAEVADAAGTRSVAAAPNSIRVGDGPMLALTSASPIAEVGVPFPVRLSSEGIPPGSTALVNSGTGAIDLVALSDPQFVCQYAVPGPETISVGTLFGSTLPLAATENVTVVPYLSVGGALPSLPGEVNRTSAFSVVISGGVPPFGLRVGPQVPGIAENETVWQDGTVAIGLNVSSTGSVPILVSVSDGAGATAPPVAVDFAVAPSLNASFSATTDVGANGTAVALSGVVTGGVAPAVWAVVPGAPAEALPSEGGFVVAGGFGWSATFAEEGSLSIRATAVDAAGAFVSEILPVALVSALSIEASVNATRSAPNSTLWDVTLDVRPAGGIPPVEVELSINGSVVANVSLPVDGPAVENLSYDGSGLERWTLVAVDSMGVFRTVGGELELPAAGPGTTPGPTPPAPVVSPSSGTSGGSEELAAAGAAALVLAAVAVLFGIRRAHRRRSPPPPPPDPVAVLRELLEPSDGADRTTIELLAEETGIPLSTVRETIDRLVAEGTIRSDRSNDGEEALTWSDLGGQ